MTHGSAGGIGVLTLRRGRAEVLPLPQPLEPFLGRAVHFRTISWLGDGWIWYGVMLALPLVYGLDGLQASLHMVATGALGLTLYKLIKNHAVRERPYITHSAIECASAPLDRYSFPSGRTPHAVCFTLLHSSHFPEWHVRAHRRGAADRAIARDSRAPLPDRCRRGRRARRIAGLRQLAARHVFGGITLKTSMLKRSNAPARRASRWWSAPMRFTANAIAAIRSSTLPREGGSWLKQNAGRHSPVGCTILVA